MFQNVERQAECWIELESYKIAFPGSFTSNDKMLNYSYFQDLYKLIEPSAAGQQTGYAGAQEPYQRR